MTQSRLRQLHTLLLVVLLLLHGHRPLLLLLLLLLLLWLLLLLLLLLLGHRVHRGAQVSWSSTHSLVSFAFL